MSYDLTIRSDEQYSRRSAKGPLMAFIAGLANVKASGSKGFVLDDGPRRWMEIDLEVVSEEGDNIEESGEEYPEVNCLRLHIPYAYFRNNTFNHDYLPTALEIARHLQWTLTDDQTGQIWPPNAG